MFLFALAYAQQGGDNAVIVKGVTYLKVMNALLDSGYQIEKTDKDLGTATTKYQHLKRVEKEEQNLPIRTKGLMKGQPIMTMKLLEESRLYYAIKLRVKEDRTAIFSLLMYDSGDGHYSNKKKWDEMYSSVGGEMFTEITDFAKSLNSQITYAKL